MLEFPFSLKCPFNVYIGNRFFFHECVSEYGHVLAVEEVQYALQLINRYRCAVLPAAISRFSSCTSPGERNSASTSRVSPKS